MKKIDTSAELGTGGFFKSQSWARAAFAELGTHPKKNAAWQPSCVPT